jgi:hypothetical protein
MELSWYGALRVSALTEPIYCVFLLTSWANYVPSVSIHQEHTSVSIHQEHTSVSIHQEPHTLRVLLLASWAKSRYEDLCGPLLVVSALPLFSSAPGSEARGRPSLTSSHIESFYGIFMTTTLPLVFTFTYI